MIRLYALFTKNITKNRFSFKKLLFSGVLIFLPVILLLFNFSAQSQNTINEDIDTIFLKSLHRIYPWIFHRAGKSLLPLYNAIYPLYIPTYDYSAQPTHPCIIDFLYEQAPGKTWGGYRYWMIMTPFPYMDGTKENPDLICSNDGIHWMNPKNLKNPLALPDPPIYVDNADPEIIYNPQTNELWTYYITRGQLAAIMLIRVKEDMTYSAPVVLVHNGDLVSPTVWRESASSWHMWVITVSTQKLYHLYSTDGIHWRNPVLCLNSLNKDPFQKLGTGYKIWHGECKPNIKENRIEFIFCARDYWAGGHPSNTPYLIYAECAMNNPTVIQTPLSQYLMVCSWGNKWDNGKLYRSTFEIIDVDTAYLYKIWYAGMSSIGKWGIGFVQAEIGTTYTKTIFSHVSDFKIMGRDSIYKGDSVRLESTTKNATSYSWFFNGNPVTNANKNYIYAKDSGRYALSCTFADHFSVISASKRIRFQARYVIHPFCCELSIPDSIIPVADVQIYPNPVRDILHIDFISSVSIKNVSISMFNAQGKEIYHFYPNSMNSNIDLGKYNPGLYFIKINYLNKGLVYKFYKVSQ